MCLIITIKLSVKKNWFLKFLNPVTGQSKDKCPVKPESMENKIYLFQNLDFKCFEVSTLSILLYNSWITFKSCIDHQSPMHEMISTERFLEVVLLDPKMTSYKDEESNISFGSSIKWCFKIEFRWQSLWSLHDSLHNFLIEEMWL